ncbi:hypothetical protein [Acidovorax phage ACPWH]|nr:hypothetical protein [Acidovorax phage ACPWH]
MSHLAALYLLTADTPLSDAAQRALVLVVIGAALLVAAVIAALVIDAWKTRGKQKDGGG